MDESCFDNILRVYIHIQGTLILNKAIHKIVLKLCIACILSSGLIYDEVQDKRCPRQQDTVYFVYISSLKSAGFTIHSGKISTDINRAHASVSSVIEVAKQHCIMLSPS